LANRCPFCGGPIDSGQVLDRDRRKVNDGREPPPGDEISDSNDTSNWAATWSRGSFGTLGRFQLRERLGDGGFGEVFLAFDPRLDRDVALKVLKQSNPSERVMERFFREARAAARLDHPNIVAVHDAGFNDGRCWVAFHFVSGRPLNWYRDHHRLDPPTAARIFRDLADAVDHAHRQGVLHRDIKPANVLIDDHGRPRLIDFGLARRSDLDSSLTHDGAVVGTPAYMSPEQALGYSRQVDERSDVFSLGVIFFEVLCGHRPETDPSATASSGHRRTTSGSHEGVDKRRTDPSKRRPALSARLYCPEVPPALDRICVRAIASNPQDRYPSARVLADDLDHWLLQYQGGQVRHLSTITKALLVLGAAFLLAVGLRSGLSRWNVGGTTTQERALPAVALPDPPLPDATSVHQESTAPAARDGSGGISSPVPDRPDENRLIGSRNSKHYHRATCSYVQSISPGNRIELENSDEAAESGLKPCGYCLGGSAGHARDRQH
jgi:serine/threonine protein kinase